MVDRSSDFSWLHISDFHFATKGEYDRNVVLDAFLSSLPSLMERHGVPDAVFVTGDIAYSGKAAEYNKATQFLDKLIEIISIDKNKLFIIPGNHDVNRDSGRGLARTLKNSQEADSYFDGASDLLHIKERMSEFRAWYDEYFLGIRQFPVNTTGIGIESFDHKGRQIEIFLLNSSAFCIDDSDHGKLWMGRRCVSEICKKPAETKNAFRLALIHHPFEWLAAEEQSNIKALVRDNTDCVLSGHLHENDFELHIGVTGNSLHMAAGAMYQTRKWPNTAVFCKLSGNCVTVSPVRYEDKPREVWTVDTSIFPSEPSFQKVFKLPRALENEMSQSQTGQLAQGAVGEILAASPKAIPEKVEFERELFVAPSGAQLYVQPRLMTIAQDYAVEGVSVGERIDIKEIVHSETSFIIETRTEYGSSTIAKRLSYEFAENRDASFVKDAGDLPKYRKKLEEEFPSEIQIPNGRAILILDNYNPERDERLVKEINHLGWFQRVVLLYVNRGLKPSNTISVDSEFQQFRYVYLWTLSRSDIREMAAKLFDSADQVFLSAIVDKVYGDLLGLCIPLTPSNVIMYLRVLFREGEFQPLNRVDILGKYISEILRKPGDAYTDSFSAKNKIDVVSSFAYHLFKNNKSSFRDLDWYNFIEKYQSDTLSEFDAKGLIGDLEAGKIFIRFSGEIYFKYSFYFSYFLGRYVSNRPAILNSFIEGGGHLRVRGVVDVITGLSVENTELLNTLSERLHELLGEFSTTYIPMEFDPLAGAIWPDTHEEENLWRRVTSEIEAGPDTITEIDNVKTSMLAEVRTADQEVRYAAYIRMETALFAVANILTDALKNSDDVSGELKLKAQDAILKSHFVGYQLGCAFADLLAKSRIFKWGGIAFLDFDQLRGCLKKRWVISTGYDSFGFARFDGVQNGLERNHPSALCPADGTLCKRHDRSGMGTG